MNLFLNTKGDLNMSKIKTAIHLLKTPGKMILPLAKTGIFNWMPDKQYLQFAYRAYTGEKLHLDNPVTFNEKLQWIKLYDRNPQYCIMVDKCAVKKYVASIIGEDYIIPTIGKWETPEDIDVSQLPQRFVLKCTHDSGSIVRCYDKSNFDLNAARIHLQNHYKKNTYWFGREWPYYKVKPQIIAEPYLEEKKQLNSGNHDIDNSKGQECEAELADYKVHCFNGEPKVILVCKNRFSGKMTEDFFDTEWNHIAVRREKHGNSIEPIQRPQHLGKILELARVLSKDIPFIRTDFYIINNQIYFGELTFFPASGFEKFIPETFNILMGSWINLDLNK